MEDGHNKGSTFCSCGARFKILTVLFMCMGSAIYVVFMMGYVTEIKGASHFRHQILRFKNLIVSAGENSQLKQNVTNQKSDLKNLAIGNKLLNVKNKTAVVTVPARKISSTTVKPTEKIVKVTKPVIVKPKKLNLPPPKPTARPESCADCNLHNFNYILNEPNICAVGEVDLLLLILSTPKRVEQRKIIRETWASVSKENTANVRHVFLFGFQKEKANNDLLKEESLKHHDILQEDFVDSYGNLTLKTMMGFKWAVKYCLKSKYILKIDDDMWANTPKILEKVKSKEFDNILKDKAYGGMCIGPAGPIRDSRSKWFASRLSYPSNIYPRFCAGPGYLISSKVAKDVVEISKNVPFFHLEDIFMSICIKKLGYSAIKLGGFHNSKVRFNACSYKKNIMTSHEVSVGEIKSAWTAWCV